ncbi:hypothetical protein OR1_02192 [Geobacter sp. OR-1]|uniref:hypothetical protein n=1 Tax=Geobacter sp. OR-1 TaxID=1266765 RepID=UPI000543E78A|nr:hypothetical protein [Geobacter sp. OR-1]GAM09910.1 hypothetical protein OR1_02192 [Geobacter sp. OR-1]
MLRIPALIIACALIAAVPGAHAEEQCAELLKQKDEATLSLVQENAALKEQVTRLQMPALTAGELNSRMISRMREIAAEVKSQRLAMNEFQGYVTWMSGSVAGYSKYIEAGSMAAGFAKALPIPYAGQAGMFTKFVSHFTLSLSAASKSITVFLASSQQFADRMDALDPAKEKDIYDLARFADEQLLRDITDLQTKLATTSELSASALSFLESLNHYMLSSDEYWARAKSLVKRDADKKEKSFLAESVSGLKGKAVGFNARLKGYDDSVRKEIPLIKSLETYSELLAFLKWRQAEEGRIMEVSPSPAPPASAQ